MTFLRWIFGFAVLSMWGALIGTSLYMALYKTEPAEPKAAAIVVLAGLSLIHI